MTQILKQNYPIKIFVGPVVDKTNATSLEDSVKLLEKMAYVYRHNNTKGLDISQLPFEWVNPGGYSLTLDSQCVNTLGPLSIVITNDDIHRPIRQDYMVVSPHAYEAIVEGKFPLEESSNIVGSI